MLFFRKKPKAVFLKQLIVRLETSKIAKESDLKGCSDDEIKALEEKYHLILPKAYKEYLTHMGRTSGRLFTHDHLAVFYKHVLNLTQEFLDDVVNEPDDDDYYNAPDNVHLPKKALIISGRLGAWWLFILCNGDDNPPVWSIDENNWNVEKFHPSVTQWLEDNCIQAEEAVKAGYFKRQPQGTTP